MGFEPKRERGPDELPRKGGVVMYDFTYLSLGAGVQSSALLVLCAQGKAPRPDVAIFADTQDEPQWVYDHLDRLEEWSPIPIERVTRGCISGDVEARHNGGKPRFASIPAFTLGSDGRAAPLRRQCTREYKIEPIEKHVRTLLGYKPRQRIKESVRCLIGISRDEVQRIKPSRTRWITNEWPLIGLNLRRHQCIAIVQEARLGEPQKSSCVFCPYHSDTFWRRLKEHHPQEFTRAVKFDRVIRDMSTSGVRSPVYLHRSLQPLDEVDFTEYQRSFDGFGNECEGYCGV